MTVFKYKNGKLVQVAGNSAGNSGSGSSSESQGSALPVGSIFASAIPLNDAKVHLLDGSTISQTGVYADFASLVKTLVSNGYNISCTQSDFDDNVSTYGQCGKFVIDNENGNIRLPLITEFIASNNGGKTIGLAELDSFKSHEHSVKNGQGRYIQISSTSGSYTGGRVSSGTAYYEESNEGYTVKAQATGDSETKPKNIRYPYYIVLASGYKSTEQVDIDNIMSELNNNQGIKFAEDERLKTLNKFSSDIVQGAWYFATGNYGTATEYICNGTKIYCNPNTTYTISFSSTTGNVSFAGLIFYNSSDAMVSSISLESNSLTQYTFTTPSDAYYVCFTFWKGSYTATIYPNEITNIMLNEGSTALSYQPYYGNIVHKEEMVGAFVPSSVYEDLGTSSDFYYTPPENGYIALKGVCSTNLTTFAVIAPDLDAPDYEEVIGTTQGYGQQRFIPVRKGVRYRIAYSNVQTSHSWGFYIRFYYSQGEV